MGEVYHAPPEAVKVDDMANDDSGASRPTKQRPKGLKTVLRAGEVRHWKPWLSTPAGGEEACLAE